MRHTILKAADGPPRGALWCTWFDGDCDGGAVRAAKVMIPDVSSAASDRWLDIGGHGWIGAAGAEGGVGGAEGGDGVMSGVGGGVGGAEGGDGVMSGVDGDGDGSSPFRAEWRLTFRDPEPPMFHLPKPWMYTAPLPRTKSISAAPTLTLGGALTVDGAAVDVDGWPCTIGHNWGTEHAERWIWLHADASAPGAAGGGPVWLDVVIGRIRVGPVTTPWIGNGAISLGGERYRLGGLRPGATRVVETDRGVTVTLRGSGLTVVARPEIDLSRSVAWTYADPAGHTREVVNSSVARTTLRIERDGRPPLEIVAPVSAFELGAPRRAFDVALQPFPD